MARKAKAETVKKDQEPARSAEEIFKDHYPQILLAKVEAEKKDEDARKARGGYRATLKAFKKAGGNVEALTYALGLRHCDPDEITRLWTGINGYARLMNLPIGTQLGLFGEGESIATQIENEKLGAAGAKDKGPERATDKTLTACRKDGAKASAAGKFATENPHEDGTPAFLAWAGGFRDDTEKRALAMGASHSNGSAETHASA
jgi:hypothetical protein